MSCLSVRASVYRSSSQRLNNSSSQSEQHNINSNTETSSCDDEYKKIIKNQIHKVWRRYSKYQKNFCVNKSNNENCLINSSNNFSRNFLAKFKNYKFYVENKDESFDEDSDSKLSVPSRRRN